MTQYLTVKNLPQIGDVIRFWSRQTGITFTPERDFLYYLVVDSPVYREYRNGTPPCFFTPLLRLKDNTKDHRAYFYLDRDDRDSDWILISRINDDT